MSKIKMRATVNDLKSRLELVCDDCGPDSFKERCAYLLGNLKTIHYLYVLDNQYYADTDTCAVVESKDGRFWVFEEWSDSSGYGCQCDTALEPFPTLEDAIRLGMTEEHRETYLAEKLGEK